MTLELLTKTFPKTIAYREEGLASCTPYLTQIDGETWTSITNGVAAMAVRSSFCEEREDRIGKVLAFDATMRRTRVPFGDLKSWALALGPYLADSACVECGGCGTVVCNYDHNHHCVECDGRGTVVSAVDNGDDQATGTLSLVPLNRRLLGFLLTHLEAPEVDVYAKGPNDRVIIDAGDWRVVVMPVRVAVSASSLPAFEATP